MKRFFILLLLSSAFIMTSNAQDTDPLDDFDFWIGHWSLTWDEGEGVDGKGTNFIESTLGGKVIQENFEATEGQSKGFVGTSVSVYNPQSKEWKQTWVDNQGAYLNFYGIIDGDKRIFQSKPVDRNGKEFVTRMVFYDIQENDLTWDWETSLDGGETWKLQWRIFYKRIDNLLSDFGSIHQDAPDETKQFGQMVGSWNCTIQSLQQDGSWKTEQATWDWFYALDGYAIQDDWSKSDVIRADSSMFDYHGTNIRIYNPKQNKWICAWMENGRQTMDGLWEAQAQEDGSIHMHDGSGTWLITFFNITDQSFDWKYEVQQQDGSMRVQSKIQGIRKG